MAGLRHFRRLLIASSIALLMSCSVARRETIDESIADPTLIGEDFHGQQRLFSRAGFSALDADRKHVVMDLYRSDGSIDAPKVRALDRSVRATLWEDGVRLDFPENSYSNVVLKPGFLISLDPVFDELVRGIVDVMTNGKRVVPMVPITIPAR